MEIPGADHFDVVNAKSEAWQKAIIPALVPLANHDFDARKDFDVEEIGQFRLQETQLVE